ncbi:toprim domain-containing protein [Streptomyces smyrnaeus]|uniref:toprim domain-containing protein n=1 Tax=Streptomyces smyrnaeus TaxID=1387713 RepID=UPI003676A11F
MAEATNRYHKAIAGNETARAFLVKRLGDLSWDSARYFSLGVVDDPLPGHEAYTGMLCIPYVAPYGVVGLKFRCLVDHDCKAVHKNRYLFPPGHTHRPYNTAALSRAEPYLAICEGEIDTITAHMAGIPAVGFPGAGSWKKVYARMIRGYSAVYILADNDDGGTGVEKFAEVIAEDVRNARIVQMPKGHDVNSFVQESGYDALREKVGV